jgi:hypothetical protein
MAIKDIPASTILDIQNLIAQAPAYIAELIKASEAKAKTTVDGSYLRSPNLFKLVTTINPSDYNSATNQLLNWFNSTIKPNATSTKDAKATISSTFTSISNFEGSFFNIRTSVMLADPTAVAFLDTWFNKYSKLLVTARVTRRSGKF